MISGAAVAARFSSVQHHHHRWPTRVGADLKYRPLSQSMCRHVHRAMGALRHAVDAAGVQLAKADGLRAKLFAELLDRTVRTAFVNWRDAAIAIREVGSRCYRLWERGTVAYVCVEP